MKAAARRWAGGRGGPAVQADDELTNAAPLPRRGAAPADALIELAPDEVEAFALFRSLDTQWRRHPMTGTRLGIDYAAIEPVARMLEIGMTPRLLLDVQVMEAAVIELQAERL